MSESNINIFINNNPKCNTTLKSIPKNEVWDMKNEPYIKIKGENFKNGKKKIKVLIDEKEIYKDTIKVENNCFTIKIDLYKPLDSPKIADIIVENEEFSTPINIKKLYGTVKFYDNSPVKNPIVSVIGKDIVAIGDKEGNFEIDICEKEKQIGIFEKNYSKKTLESWLYNVDIKEDTRIDIKIDKLEVYNINMWEGQMSDYIHFIPMSLTRANKIMEEGFESELELLSKEELWPKLDKTDIKLYADEDEVKILTFNEVDDFIGEFEDEIYTRPSYVISIPKGYKDKVIKIEIESEFVSDSRGIVEKGEGYYFWR